MDTCHTFVQMYNIKSEIEHKLWTSDVYECVDVPQL